MKAFTVIFVLYLLLLSMMPCVERGSCGTAHTVSTELPGDHRDGHDSDCCSPFCVCACCHNVVVISERIHLEASRPVENRESSPTIMYSASLQGRVQAEIFQPPRVS